MTALREQTQPSYFRAGINPAGSGADIPPHRFVQQGTNKDEVALAAAATNTLLGVSFETIYEGKSQSYKVSGPTVVEAGGAVAIGDRVTTDANGKAVTAATGNIVKGFAKSAAASDGDLMEIELFEGIAFNP